MNFSAHSLVEIRRLKWKKLKGGPTGGETLVPQQY